MWDLTLTSELTTISLSPLLVSLFTFTQLPIACESFYIFKSVYTSRVMERDTTPNPMCPDTRPKKVTMALIPIVVTVHNNDE
jgi:hypothetical protein